MKNIVVLTDFSDNAASAAEAGLMLCGKLHTNLLLFHSYIAYPAIEVYSADQWSAVDDFNKRQQYSRTNLASLTEGLESLTGSLLSPEDYLPEINSLSEDIEMGQAVTKILEKNNTELIVMGARSFKSNDLLSGTYTHSVIKNALCPVLIMPAKSSLKHISKIVFATDFNRDDIRAVRLLEKIGRAFSLHLEIMHVVDSFEEKRLKTSSQIDFEDDLAAIKYSNLSFRVVKGKEVMTSLRRSAQQEAGLLAMKHQQRSFFERLFVHSYVEEALEHQNIPILVFPAKYH